MKISLSVESYSGVDGSSLSEVRCNQILLIYNMLESLGEKRITYVGLQELADQYKIFGKTKAGSAVRTFFPLLRKLGFVNYDNQFPANKCFTEAGKAFVLAIRAISMVQDDTPHKDEVLSRLKSIKSDAIKQGIIHMNHDPELKNHNIWIALKLLSEFTVIDWNEFLYVLHRFEEDEDTDLDTIIAYIRDNREKIASYEFTNMDGKPLPNTCYSYIRGLLVEAGLITRVSNRTSKITSEANFFFKQISL